MKTRIGAIVAAIGIMIAPAHAGQGIDSKRLSTEQLKQFQASKAKNGKAGTPRPEYNYDIRPPVIKSLTVEDSSDLALKGAQVVVRIEAEDNLSGVKFARVELVSPSGNQYAYGETTIRYPTTLASVRVAVEMEYATEPGLWRVNSAAVYDANDNIRSFSASELTKVPPIYVDLINSGGDTQVPAVSPGGVNLTPVVQYLRPPAGMLPENSARIGIALNVVDLGVAGIRSAYATFCNEFFECLYLSSFESTRGLTSLTLTLGGEADRYLSPGRYRAESLEIYDHSGNRVEYNRSQRVDIGRFIDIPEITLVE